jgi:hypothetical protein
VRNQLLLTLAIMTWLSLRPGMADPLVTPASLVPCPFTPAEIEATLGLKVNAGEAADMKLPAGRDVGCIYQAVGGSTTVAVRQTWDPTGSIGAPQAVADKNRSIKAIPGDADGAQWKVGSQSDDEPRVELSYTRGMVQTRVIVHGRSFRAPDIQPNLLNLRRVP